MREGKAGALSSLRKQAPPVALTSPLQDDA